MNMSGFQFDRSYGFEDFRSHENQLHSSQLQHHDHHLNYRPQQTFPIRQTKTIREMFDECISRLGIDIHDLEEEGLTPMSIKLCFRSYLRQNGLVIDKELLDLFVDMILRPEEKEIEKELTINEEIESDEDIEIDHGNEEIEVACDELMTSKESEGIDIIEDKIENTSDHTYDEDISEDEFEMNDIINFDSPQTYHDEHPKETENDDIKEFTDGSIFEKIIDGEHADNEMIYDLLPPTYDDYSAESDCDDEIEPPSIIDDRPLESENIEIFEIDSPPLFDDHQQEDEFEEIEIIEEGPPTIYDQIPLNDEYMVIEMNEDGSIHESFEKESDYVEIEPIENQIPHVFVQRPHEHDYYTVDFIDDNIYDMFAQRVEQKLTRILVERYMIFDERSRHKNRVRARKDKNLCMTVSGYKFFHLHYKDTTRIVRKEWVETYEIQDPP